MTIRIKIIKNGWLVHYELWKYSSPVNYAIDVVKTGEEEKAFTYDFEDEKDATWRKLVEFISKLFFVSSAIDKLKEIDDDKAPDNLS